MLALVLVACGGDEDPPDLAERVRGLLDAGAEAEIECPVVRDAEAGDLATCVVTHGDGRETEVDVEFEEGGTITVVAVQDR